MPRTIYLAIFKNPGRAAHWAIFVPTNERRDVGNLIHVSGSPAGGFFREFRRNYDFSKTPRVYEMIPLADVDDCFVAAPRAHVQPTVDNRFVASLRARARVTSTVDDTPRDRLEMAAKIVDPPPVCSNPFDRSNENCQGWIRRYVQQLVNEGLVDPSALLVIQNAPEIL